MKNKNREIIFMILDLVLAAPFLKEIQFNLPEICILNKISQAKVINLILLARKTLF
jgi:hypothetical protein